MADRDAAAAGDQIEPLDAEFRVAGLGSALAAFFATFFGTDGTLDFLALIERVILAMNRIY